MRDHLKRAATLVVKLQELAKENSPIGSDRPRRSGDEVATDQLSVFGELLVVLARHLDQAQQTVARLTWALVALTAFLVIDAALRAMSHFWN
jgi:hypothetical protein